MPPLGLGFKFCLFIFIINTLFLYLSTYFVHTKLFKVAPFTDQSHKVLHNKQKQ